MPSDHPNRPTHDRRYRASEKGRESRRRANAKYRATTKGMVAAVRTELNRIRKESSESQV